MNPSARPARAALDQARRALLSGDRTTARHWAEQAALQDAQYEDAWLMLAATASPRASIIYLERALAINPDSQRARQGMHWAIQRLRNSQSQPGNAGSTQPIRLHRARPTAPGQVKSAFPYRGLAGLAGILLLLTLLGIAWFRPAQADGEIKALVLLSSPAPLPSATATLPPAPTITFTSTPTTAYTDTPTSTFTEAPTPTPNATFTLLPTEPAPPTNTPKPFRPEGVGDNEFWIEVDLSQQAVVAHQGDQRLANFTVSTGKAGTPTVTGTYQVYVKYRSADMWGPGYYLPGVPYVMYFYEGYGLHGTYWHNNFGVPASHGCVNLRTEDAAWLFESVKIGTVVSIHR